MKRILFISHSKRGSLYYHDASARYRCVFPAEHLNELGLATDVIPFKSINQIKLNNYSHIIFHRPQYSLKLKWVIYKIQQLGIKAIVDFDDLLFNPTLSNNSAAVQAGYMSLSVANSHAVAYQKALGLFKYCWVSTERLAKQVKTVQAAIKVTVCPNKLPMRWSKLVTVSPSSERLKNKIIRYMPGTSHHKHDFNKIENTLISLLESDVSIRLEIVGQLQFNSDKFPKNQISQQPFVTFEQLPEMICTSWLTLAPLENNIFNQCKSGLKFWESGLYGVPAICSPLADLTPYENDGLCLSDAAEVWLSYIDKMKQPQAYLEASKAAQSKAQNAVFNIQQNDDRLIDLNANQNTAEPKQETTQKSNRHYHQQQLIMCAEYGPSWPAIMLNPTHSNYVAINKRYEELNNEVVNINTQQQEELLSQGKKQILQDQPKKQARMIRKLKKLLRSPKEFWVDSAFKKRL